MVAVDLLTPSSGKKVNWKEISNGPLRTSGFATRSLSDCRPECTTALDVISVNGNRWVMQQIADWGMSGTRWKRLLTRQTVAHVSNNWSRNRSGWWADRCFSMFFKMAIVFQWVTRPPVLVTTAVIFTIGWLVLQFDGCSANAELLPKYWLLTSLLLLTSGFTFRTEQLKIPTVFQALRTVILFLTLFWLSTGHVLVVSSYPPGKLCLPLFYYTTVVLLVASSVLFTTFTLLFIHFLFFHSPRCGYRRRFQPRHTYI